MKMLNRLAMVMFLMGATVSKADSTVKIDGYTLDKEKLEKVLSKEWANEFPSIRNVEISLIKTNLFTTLDEFAKAHPGPFKRSQYISVRIVSFYLKTQEGKMAHGTCELAVNTENNDLALSDCEAENGGKFTKLREVNDLHDLVVREPSRLAEAQMGIKGQLGQK